MEPSRAVVPPRRWQSFRRRRERLKSIQWKRRKHIGQNGEIDDRHDDSWLASLAAWPLLSQRGYCLAQSHEFRTANAAGCWTMPGLLLLRIGGRKGVNFR